MKYAKTFSDLLSSPNFDTPEFRASAVQYKQLKKIITRVIDELSALGLTADVLQELMVKESAEEEEQQQHDADADNNKNHSILSNDNVHSTITTLNSNTHCFPHGIKSNGGSSTSSNNNKKKRQRKRRARAEYELAGTPEHPQPRIKVIFSSSGSESNNEDDVNDNNKNDTIQDVDYNDKDNDNIKNQQHDLLPQHAFIRKLRRSSTTSSSSRRPSEDDDAQSQSEDHAIQSPTTTKHQHRHHPPSPLIGRLYGINVLPIEHVTPPGSPESTLSMEPLSLESSPSTAIDDDLHHINKNEPLNTSVANPIIEIHENDDISENYDNVDGNTAVSIDEDVENCSEQEQDADADADDESPRSGIAKPTKKHQRHRYHNKGSNNHKKHHHRREVYISLENDTKFFELLGQALSNLSKLQIAQKSRFAESVQALSRQVAKVSTPNKSKTDLYAWRDIFSLWIEAEIFEGEREWDRKIHTVEDAERRLQWFADQVGRRHLANDMKHSASRSALEDFVKLNATLIDLKKFQRANEEAIRKILKKHDKQTYLSSSTEFQSLVRTGKTNAIGPSEFGVIDVLPSLPHILLSTFTDTLLPILPQVDDYSCMICGDIAYRPIRLDCSHFFCLRDLVKMQKRGQNACPACRAPVVMRADGANLDSALLSFMNLWFPKEVKAKQKESENEVLMEEMGDLDFKGQCIIS